MLSLRLSQLIIVILFSRLIISEFLEEFQHKVFIVDPLISLVLREAPMVPSGENIRKWFGLYDIEKVEYVALPYHQS